MVNRRNYQLVCEYLDYLAQVSQLEPASVGRYWSYFKYLLIWADENPLSKVTDLRPTFSSFLGTMRLDGESGLLSPATLKKIFQTVKRFLTWLKLTYPREFREMSATWIEALRPPRSVVPLTEHEFVTLDEVLHLTALKIDENDLALQRDQAAAALLLLSGARAGAFTTLPLAAVDLSQRTIKQWPALHVETKNDKSATTYLLEIPELLAIAGRWDQFIRSRLPDTAMWYTPIIGQWGERTLSVNRPGANRNVAIAKRMRLLFDRAGLPRKSPHKFRHGHAVYALQHAKTMADYKAVSMNLMHQDIRVTDGIYAPLLGDEVRQRIANLTAAPIVNPTLDGDLLAHLNGLSKAQLSAALIAIAHEMAK